MYCDLWWQYIQVRKLFKGGNYSRAETIRGNTVVVAIIFHLCKENLNTFFTRLWKLFKGGKYSREKTIHGNMVCISCNKIRINMVQTLEHWNLTTLGMLSSKHIRDEQILPRWINFPLFYWLVFFSPVVSRWSCCQYIEGIFGYHCHRIYLISNIQNNHFDLVYGIGHSDRWEHI